MRLGLIGLGRMGAGVGRRLLAGGHEVIGFDLSADNSEAFSRTGGETAASLEDLVARLETPRALWLMLPHGAPTRATIEALLPSLNASDLLVDGGNSHYPESIAHAERCRGSGVDFVDVGVSGGVWGLAEGFNLMVGGSRSAFERLEPVLATLAAPGGYAHVGGSGAGHFVKMIHNAIEYVMLQAIGEGFECLRSSEFELDLGQIAGLWQKGSVVRSWLLDLLARALQEEGNSLERIGAFVDDSGTGRWAIEYAVQHGIPAPAMSAALFERFDSRTDKRFAHQVIAALREQFGGHAVAESP